MTSFPCRRATTPRDRHSFRAVLTDLGFAPIHRARSASLRLTGSPSAPSSSTTSQLRTSPNEADQQPGQPYGDLVARQPHDALLVLRYPPDQVLGQPFPQLRLVTEAGADGRAAYRQGRAAVSATAPMRRPPGCSPRRSSSSSPRTSPGPHVLTIS